MRNDREPAEVKDEREPEEREPVTHSLKGSITIDLDKIARKDEDDG
jgi:hypothetical protein